MNTFFKVSCALLLVHLATVLKSFALYSLMYGFDALRFTYALIWVLWTMAVIIKYEEFLTLIAMILKLSQRGARRK